MATRRRTGKEDCTPLLVEEGVVPTAENAKKKKDKWKHQSGQEWDPNLPYGGKVYLPRIMKDDPLWVKIAEASVLVLTVLFALYAYFYFDHLHFHVTHGYAHLGFPQAQHQVGQRYLHGVGTEQNDHLAMGWFKKAADQGHPHASYNLAIGHLKGLRKDLLEKGEAHRLIQHAAAEGVHEAHRVLNEVCSKGGCK